VLVNTSLTESGTFHKKTFFVKNKFEKCGKKKLEFRRKTSFDNLVGVEG
jgi:hypothetical protein